MFYPPSQTIKAFEQEPPPRNPIPSSEQQVGTDKWTIEGGILLGQQRCQTILPWDLDADVAIHADSIMKPMALLEQKKNVIEEDHKPRFLFTLKQSNPAKGRDPKRAWCPYVVVDLTTGYFCDVFRLDPAPDAGPGGIQHSDGGRKYHTGKWFPTQPCAFAGKQYPCPVDAANLQRVV